jgi:hypothetical protein
MWARMLGRKGKWFVDEQVKDEIIQYGLEKNSWEEAAQKFGISSHTVVCWKRKAGVKLTRKKASLRKSESDPHLATNLLCHTNVGPHLLNTEGIENVKNDDTTSLEALKTEAYGKASATEKTPAEDSSEGLCDVCGKESEDFVHHFKMHLTNFKDPVDPPPMVIIKEECLYESQNYTSSDLVVKEVIRVKDDSMDGEEQWVIDTFYSN